MEDIDELGDKFRDLAEEGVIGALMDALAEMNPDMGAIPHMAAPVILNAIMAVDALVDEDVGYSTALIVAKFLASDEFKAHAAETKRWYHAQLEGMPAGALNS